MKRDRWLLGISIAIFSVLAVYYLRPRWLAVVTGRKSPIAASRPSLLPAPPQEVASSAPSQTAPTGETIDEQTPWGRNPFLTEEEEAAGRRGPAGDLQVKAIIVGPPGSVATIDGRSVTVGETIGGETVSEIRPDAVVLERDGRKRVVKVREPAVSVEVKERKK